MLTDEHELSKLKTLKTEVNRNRSSGDIISNKWMYLINHPLNFQAVDYVIQKLRQKHPGDYYDSKCIKQTVYNIHS